MRIMLIDDSKTMRNIQKLRPQQLGHTEIEEACDGQDALSKVGAYKPDLCWWTGTCPTWTG
jgi:chemotaxis response regulator CheB